MEVAENNIDEVDDQSDNNLQWMLIFTDMVALLLSFFVMLFSMSAVPVNEWETTIDILEEALNLTEDEEKDPTEDYNISSVMLERAKTNVSYLLPIIEPKILADPTLSKTPITLLDDRIVLSLPGNLLFKPGSAKLQDVAQKTLFSLGGILRNIKNTIGVYGYSEEETVDKKLYSSNWELSLARAVAVSNELKRAGYMDEILSFGFGSARSFKLRDFPADQRKSLSRRVDIVILPIRGLK